MPLTRFKLSAIADGGIATVDLADDAVTTAKIDDGAVTLAKTDSLFVNTEISGTEAARMPQGTTAQRANAAAGDIRFNSTTSLMEYYDGTQWKSIDAPPAISSINPTNFDAAGETITISGSNFNAATVKIIGDDGTEYTPDSVTTVSSTSITFDTTSAMNTDNDPFDIKVTNNSGLSNILNDSLDWQTSPSWTTNSGSLGTFYNYNRTGLSYSVAATSSDADDTISYAITSGSLPSGLTLNTSTGAITGDAPEVGSSTTYTFEITPTATSSEVDGGTTDGSAREFTLTNAASVVTSYTSTGSGTFSVPSGISSVDVLVVGGGGGQTDSKGGAGGLVYAPSYPVTPGGSVSYSVGGGGGPEGPTTNGWQNGEPGQNSTFGSLTAQGGGGAGGGAGQPGLAGGSGGGGGGTGGMGSPGAGGPGTQPSNGGHPTGQGFGNPGGNRSPSTNDGAGGGGGAGGAGGNGSSSPSVRHGLGGIDKTYSISGSPVGYAGGGSARPGSSIGGGQPFGGGNPDVSAVANRGGGGGGSGIVIVSY